VSAELAVEVGGVGPRPQSGAPPHRARWRGRCANRFATLFGLGALSLLLSGCLSTGYTYLSHTVSNNTILYFKLPSTWSRFTGAQLLKSANGNLTDTQVKQIQGQTWTVAFSAAPHPKLSSVSSLSQTVPTGTIFIRQLTGNTRDTFSYAALRAELLGEDPLASSTSSPFNVLSYQEFVHTGGIRGSELVTDIADPSGVTDTFAQIVEVDAATNWVYAIGIGCRASCWAPNQSTIKQVLDSWNVKEIVHG
jgi:hypothetical protein